MIVRTIPSDMKSLAQYPGRTIGHVPTGYLSATQPFARIYCDYFLSANSRAYVVMTSSSNVDASANILEVAAIEVSIDELPERVLLLSSAPASAASEEYLQLCTAIAENHSELFDSNLQTMASEFDGGDVDESTLQEAEEISIKAFHHAEALIADYQNILEGIRNSDPSVAAAYHEALATLSINEATYGRSTDPNRQPQE